MKMTNKKGFTIVELVIVVAVIAILSAVLIPTVAGLVKKANLTSDQAAARQMNEALAALEKAPANLEEAVNALEAAGYNAKKMLVPVTKGHSFIWLADKNMVILVDNNETENNYADDVLVYPAEVDDFLVAMNNVGTKNFDLEGGVAYIDVSASKADDFESALVAGTQDIKITKDITLKYASNLLVPAGANVTVDLGGKTLTSKQNTGRHTYAMDVAGTVTIKNGTVDSRGIGVMDGGKLIIGEGVTVNAIDDNGGACVWVYEGGEVVINGGTFNAPAGNPDAAQSPAVIYNAGGNVTINGGTFKSVESFTYAVCNHGTMTINGGNFEGNRGCVSNSGKLTINGGTFNVTGDKHTGWAIYTAGGEVVVNAGSFFVVSDRMFTSKGDGTPGKITVKAGTVVASETLTEDLVLPDLEYKLD